MSLLCAWSKSPPEAPQRTPDLRRLVECLSPYRGALQQRSLPGGGTLFASSLGELDRTGCTLPRGTVKGPHSAWVDARVAADGTLCLTTDPHGMFPLWHYEDEHWLLIASEVKSLTAVPGVRVQFNAASALRSGRKPRDFSPYDNVRRVPPGARLRVTSDLLVVQVPGESLEYHPTPLTQRDQALDALHRSLVQSASSLGLDPDEPVATFLSGGIDSSVATALLASKHNDVRTYTLGTALGDEYADAAELAEHLRLEHTRVRTRDELAREHFERAVFCNETVDGLTAETLAQLSILSAAAGRGVTNVVTGYGADLLFGSMLRHELYMQVTGVGDLQSLIERTCWTGEFAPFFAWSQGVQLHHLFWDPQLMTSAFAVADELNFSDGTDKAVLRAVAVRAGYMRAQHAYRTKRALTDGTQFNRVLSRALGLNGPHAYDEKNARSVEQLVRLFGAAT